MLDTEKERLNKIGFVIFEIIAMMFLFQVFRESVVHLAEPLYDGTLFGRKMVTMFVLLVFTVVTVYYAKWRKEQLSVFPQKFSRLYLVSTIVVSALYISTPANYIEGAAAVMSLIYGSIVTPIFEELFFRGYAWNRMKRAGINELYVYLINVILFALWHIGYMIPNIINGNWTAVLWKIGAGLGYGLVLGFLRLKLKNCYATILLHGLLNLFMV